MGDFKEEKKGSEKNRDYSLKWERRSEIKEDSGVKGVGKRGEETVEEKRKRKGKLAKGERKSERERGGEK